MKCAHKNEETECKYCITSAAWAIVKDSRGMNDTGHGAAVRWARAWLELDDQPTVVGTRRVHGEPGEGAEG